MYFQPKKGGGPGGTLHCIIENDIKLQGRQDIICDLILCSVHTEVIAWLSLSFFFFFLPRPQQGAGMMDRHNLFPEEN